MGEVERYAARRIAESEVASTTPSRVYHTSLTSFLVARHLDDSRRQSRCHAVASMVRITLLKPRLDLR